MEIATIGFTQSSAERFFERLIAARVERLVDIRLHNVSQLAGFAKAGDLTYLLDRLGGISYEHDTRLAPSQDLLDLVRKRRGAWEEYERGFLALMAERDVPATLDRAAFDRKTVLLCSEPTAARCHRRLVAELLAAHWGATVEHL